MQGVRAVANITSLSILPLQDEFGIYFVESAKPVRFGFKIWCMCSSDGYLYKFMPYDGANPNAEKNQNPLDAQVVLDLISADEMITLQLLLQPTMASFIHCGEVIYWLLRRSSPEHVPYHSYLSPPFTSSTLALLLSS
ncbi:Transposase IS4 [Popillia japonica]|uniref:Transposase IS4 n=1 Tax=Popillia japonica TaxID=7064 RepID=A0AAW1L9P1_POPJA